MAKAYTPGLKVTSRIRHKVRRVLPIPGDVLVKTGDRVGARDIVAQTFMPGDITPVNMANVLGCSPADVPGCMIRKDGDKIAPGEVIARTKGMFGLMRSDVRSTWTGTIESVSKVTGQMMVRGEPLPVRVLAYLTGVVTEVLPNQGVVVEADVSMVQGIFGIGGETFGSVVMATDSPHEDLTPERISPEMSGKVVVGGRRITDKAIRRGVEVGVAALIAGGIDDQDLKDFLGYDLGVAITGSEQVGLTLIITEGFGEIAMAQRSFNLLKASEGQDASVNGTTQIRAGVMRPEIVVPVGATLIDSKGITLDPGYLEIGTPVRIIRDPYFGLIGTVSGLPSEPTVLASGSKARVLEVKLDGGRAVVIPRANVELIEG